ncbi:MAG: DUF5662 family protein [Rickettsiales bacterium]|nr:DUF5662 family protein [Rickettsiales bacterium]
MNDEPDVVVTDAMEEYFLRRLFRHRLSVNYFAELVGYHFPEHDASKLCRSEYSPYILRIWDLHVEPLPMSARQRASVSIAADHHYFFNPHHAQYWGAHTRSIPEPIMIEMSCDISAVHFEKELIRYRGQPNRHASAREYFITEEFPKYDFSDKQKKFLTDMTDELAGKIKPEDFADIWRRPLKYGDTR